MDHLQLNRFFKSWSVCDKRVWQMAIVCCVVLEYAEDSSTVIYFSRPLEVSHKLVRRGHIFWYRLQVSDGDCYQPCMVATQLNTKIASGEIEQYAIICLDKYVCNVIQGRK